MTDPLDTYLSALMRAEVCPAGEDWPAELVVERIRFHGIAAALAENGFAAGQLPPAVAAKVLEEARTQAFWEESHRAMLANLLGALAGHGVQALVMKGSALAYSLYDRPHLRRRGDTDLLIHERDLEQARLQFERLGFVRRRDPQGLVYQQSWLLDTGIGFVHAVDLHWRPNDSPVLQEVLRADEFFALAQPLPRLAPPAMAPHKVHTFLQGICNQAWHAHHGYLVDGENVTAPERLVWALDNHLLATAFTEDDWTLLADLAQPRAVAPLVLTALRKAQVHHGTHLPEAIVSRLAEGPPQTDVMRRLFEQDQVAAAMQDLRALEGIGAKLQYVRRHALPKGDYLRGKYPDSKGWPLALLHLRRWSEIALRLRGKGSVR